MAWLETTANDFINILTYAPERHDALATITGQIPQMVREMKRICQPTTTDANIAAGLIDGITTMLQSNPSAASSEAIAALADYRSFLKSSHFARSFVVIGASNYAWDLKHASLLPMDARASAHARRTGTGSRRCRAHAAQSTATRTAAADSRTGTTGQGSRSSQLAALLR